MRSLIPPILLIAMLLAMCLSAACTMPFSSDTPSDTGVVNMGIRSLDDTGGKSYTAMDIAFMQFQEYLPGEARNSPVPVYYIQGADLDSNGKAVRWIFAINLSTGPSLMNVENGVVTEVPWNSRLPESTIQIDQVISPEDLFKKNLEEISANLPGGITSAESELDLRDGVYTITIVKDSTINYLMFNAITGEPVV